MKKIIILPFLFTNLSFAGADLLLQNSTEVLSSDIKVVTEHQKINLDNPFLVQFYGHWKTNSDLSFELNNWANLIIKHDYEKAAHLLTVVKEKAPDSFKEIVDYSEVYLYWKLGLHNSFLNHWLKLASSDSTFINSQMAISLDQVIGNNASKWIVEHGIQLNSNQKILLDKIEKNSLKFYNSLMAYKALRSGKSALEWIGRLEHNDPLRFYLAQTVVLDFAKNNKLASAAKLLKEVHEPQLSKSKNVEAISKYYILLARLLYQAGALGASSSYYKKVPEQSRYFLQARTENTWISLRENDQSSLKGEIASLNLDLFADKFLPEVYLVNSISQLKLCQFDDVKKTFDIFISKNKKWAKKIIENINSENPEKIDSNDFFVALTQSSLDSLSIEKELLNTLAQKSIEATVPAVGIQKHWQDALRNLDKSILASQNNKTLELRRSWRNRKRLLSDTIKKMRFVKIEFISLMRRYSRVLAVNSDEVSTFKAGIKRTDELDFPFDGIIWGDEPFHMSAQVKSLCLKGK